MSEESNVQDFYQPKPKSTLRSKLFGVLGIALMIAGSAWGYKSYQYYQAGLPKLLGTCWALRSGITMSFVETRDAETPSGKVKVYGALVRLGPFAFPQLLKARDTNSLFAELKAKNQAIEINCMSGAPKDAERKPKESK